MRATPVTVIVHVIAAKKAPVITCDKEASYKVNCTKSEADFLKDIHGATSDGSAITTDFSSVVDFNKTGDYVVTLNAEDTLGNRATPATVIVHVVSDETAVTPGENNTGSKGILNGLPKTGTMSSLIYFGGLGLVVFGSALVYRKVKQSKNK